MTCLKYQLSPLKSATFRLVSYDNLSTKRRRSTPISLRGQKNRCWKVLTEQLFLGWARQFNAQKRFFFFPIPAGQNYYITKVVKYRLSNFWHSLPALMKCKRFKKDVVLGLLVSRGAESGI